MQKMKCVQTTGQRQSTMLRLAVKAAASSPAHLNATTCKEMPADLPASGVT